MKDHETTFQMAAGQVAMRMTGPRFHAAFAPYIARSGVFA